MEYDPLTTLLRNDWQLGNHDAPIGHTLIYAKTPDCGYVAAEVSVNDPAEYALYIAKRYSIQLNHLKACEIVPPGGARISYVCVHDIHDMIQNHLQMEDDIIAIDRYVTPNDMENIVNRYIELYQAYIEKVGIDALLDAHYFLELAA
jgi:hypothetical protein